MTVILNACIVLSILQHSFTSINSLDSHKSKAGMASVIRVFVAQMGGEAMTGNSTT